MKGSWCLSWRTCVYPGEGREGRRLRIRGEEEEPKEEEEEEEEEGRGFEARLCDIKLGERGADRGGRGAEERCTPVDWPATFNVPWTHVLMATLWLEARWALHPILPYLTTLCIPPSMILLLPSILRPVSISPPLFFSTSTPETQPSFAKYLSLYIRLYVSSQTRAICAQVGEHLANRSNRNEAEVKEEVDKEKQRIKPRKADFGRRRSTSSSRFPSHGFNAV